MATRQEYVSVRNAAEQLGLSTSEVMDLADAGTLKAVTFDGAVLVSDKSLSRHLMAVAV